MIPALSGCHKTDYYYYYDSQRLTLKIRITEALRCLRFTIKLFYKYFRQEMYLNWKNICCLPPNVAILERRDKNASAILQASKIGFLSCPALLESYLPD